MFSFANSVVYCCLSFLSLVVCGILLFICVFDFVCLFVVLVCVDLVYLSY